MFSYIIKRARVFIKLSKQKKKKNAVDIFQIVFIIEKYTRFSFQENHIVVIKDGCSEYFSTKSTIKVD